MLHFMFRRHRGPRPLVPLFPKPGIKRPTPIARLANAPDNLHTLNLETSRNVVDNQKERVPRDAIHQEASSRVTVEWRMGVIPRTNHRPRR
jgi:hypothetical protein